MPPRLSIIIPAHNEEERLPRTLPQILGHLDSRPYSSEVILVDSGSHDRTAEIGRAYQETREDFRLIRVERPGKGLAVKRGMLAATGEYRFICDADLSMPIDQVDRFFPPELESSQIAIASREIEGSVRYDEPAYRHLIGRAFNTLVRLLAIPGIQDTQCGFKCFRADIAEDLFRMQRLEGWTFDVEILYVALKRGYRIEEVPIPWYYFPGSRVHIVRDSIAMFLDLFRIRLNDLRGVYDR
ncbi:MAG: dolichyl-phosphate beta-glucosyltransferase [Anaerolineales bacterium]